jgi:hypothetical protein
MTIFKITFIFLSLLLLTNPWSSAYSSNDEYANAPDTSEEPADESAAPDVSKVFKGKKSSSNGSGMNSAHGLGLGIGQTFLLGNYGDHGSDDLTADLFYRYKASHLFDLLINFHTSTQKDSSDQEKMELLGLTTGIKARYFDFDNFSPFLLGGLGFYQPKAKRYINGALVNSETKTVLGVHFGGGAELNLNQSFSFGLQGIYHYPFRVKQETQSSLTGSYFKLMMVLFYNF